MVQVAQEPVIRPVGRLFNLPVEVRFRPVHLVQLCVHLSIFAYWSLYFAPTREQMIVVAALVPFAFLVDAVVSFARYGSWIASLGPIPVITSANLFVWYRPSGLWASFLTVFVGVSAKHLLQRHGRHIFNPSAIGVCVLAIPSLFFPDQFGEYDIGHPLNLGPNASEFILLVSMISLFKAPVVLVSIGAALMSLLMGVLQTPFFAHPYAPSVWWAPILLGITLLVTDPATTPRTQMGRLLFGAAYMALFALLGTLMNLTELNNFWAKILPVPILNVFSDDFDRFVKRFPKLEFGFLAERFNRIHVIAWVAGMAIAAFATGIKAEHFETRLQGGNHTRFLHVTAGEEPTCADNPMFCQPFSFGAEIAAWVATARD